MISALDLVQVAVARSPQLEPNVPMSVADLVKVWHSVDMQAGRAHVAKDKHGIKQGLQTFSVDEEDGSSDDGEPQWSQWVHSFFLRLEQDGKQADEVNLSRHFSVSIEVVTTGSMLEYARKDTITHDFPHGATKHELVDIVNTKLNPDARQTLADHGNL